MAGARDGISDARFAAGAACLIGAAASAELAWLHARAVAALGEICGAAPSSHCLWCPLGLAALAMGLVLLTPHWRLAGSEIARR